jgi:ribosomal protein S18 acetylase RimI-like enzyme
MNEDFVFRPLNRSDLEEVLLLLNEISPYSPPANKIDENWINFSNQTALHAFVMKHKGETVGYGSILVETKLRGGKLGHIEDIVISPKFQRQGLGKILIGFLLNHSAEIGCYKVALHCREHNKDFYKQCGFVVSGNSMQKVF